MKKKLLLLLGLLLTTTIVKAENLSGLHIALDPPVMSEASLLRIVGLPPNATIPAEEVPTIIRQILSELAREGYPLAVPKTGVLDSREGLRLSITAGPPLVSQAGGDFRFGIGEKLTAQLFSQVASAILDSLTEAGFPFAKVEVIPQNLNLRDTEIGITPQIQVTPGVYERFGEVRFPGAPSSDWNILQLRSRIRRGDPFRRTQLERVTTRLEREESIVEINEPRLIPISSGVIDLELPVAVRSSTKISGIVAVAQGSSKPTGDVHMEIGRLFKLGRSLSFSWKGLNPKRRGVEASFTEGWVAGWPVSLSASLQGESENLVGASSLYRLKCDWEPAPGITLSLAGASQRFTAEDTLRATSQTKWAESEIKFDYFDSDWNPSNGYLFAVKDRIGTRTIVNSTSSRQIHQNGARVEVARLIRGKFIGYGRVAQMQSTGFIQPEDLVRIGGSSNLRGYLEDEFLARGAVWWATELRWRPDRRSGYLGLFVDGADLYQFDPAHPRYKRLFWSFGVTSSVETAAGRLELDFGFVPGEPFEQARVHFRLTGWL